MGREKVLRFGRKAGAGFDPEQPVPVEAIVPADLSDWQYAPPLKHIAVDPVLGRFAFPLDQDQLPKKGVRVTYHYGFSADIGGGEYARPILNPSARDVQKVDPKDPTKTISETTEPTLYRVGEDQPLRHLRDALDHWREEKPLDAVIEITDSGVYVEPVNVHLDVGRTLQLRAANGARPVIRMLDWQMDLPDALTVTMCRESRFTLDGLLLTGRGMHVHGPKCDQPEDPRDPNLRRGSGHPPLYAGARLGLGVRLRTVAPCRAESGALQHPREGTHRAHHPRLDPDSRG